VRLFLDTEWADTIGSELVSLGLVSEDREHRFYAERKPLPENPTDFARHVVYPLLKHGQHALTELEITRGLRSFLSGFSLPRIIYDDANDGALFRYALDGFELSDAELTRLPPAPFVVTTLIVERDEVRRYIDRFFVECPEMMTGRHHALIDAEALAWACRQLEQRTASPGRTQPTRDAEALAACVPVHGDGDYVLGSDIPEADREAFWTFTQSQSVFATRYGMAIPYTAWHEYLTWLREDPEADPRTVTSETKVTWRLRTGRWL